MIFVGGFISSTLSQDLEVAEVLSLTILFAGAVISQMKRNLLPYIRALPTSLF